MEAFVEAPDGSKPQQNDTRQPAEVAHLQAKDRKRQQAAAGWGDFTRERSQVRNPPRPSRLKQLSLVAEAVAQTPTELTEAVLRVGSKIVRLVARTRRNRADVGALSVC